ncbi:hypothetical protein SAMN05892883_0072 [Jatrophihabitans sp. GAS493]|uniref:sulfite exporter TauE/SafE family protein n=1 Tax=Jatrophihabitans sp. GAS493 TaxID=1907575 RepID=UPI000BB71A54|nr:sulfite exporter TauE/SafE family protein [Jatrophihabitans sp. GAS493]SOD70356.1 hypothetical protein SAMN05892883_0072 [Jatrophihabitans sp. GAS493]
MTPAHILLLLVAGLAGGAVNAVAGGGTLISFPALLVAGLSPVTANVTNTVALWPGYLSGAVSYRHELRQDWERQRLLSLVAASGAVVGTIVLLTAPASVFHVLVPYLVLGATALLAAQPAISRALARRASGERHYRRGPLLACVFAASIYGAYFGGGLGIILVAVLALCLDADIQHLNGVKTLLALVVNTVAMIGFVIFGHVDWAAVALVAPASFLGGILGARAAQRLNPMALRAAVVVLGVGIGIRMLAA